MKRESSAFAPFLKLLLPHWPWMGLGILLGIAAALSGIGLLALSGWFISAAAAAGLTPLTAKLFNFFLPSIGVRLFAITRTAARYGERVVTHDATFRILESLRDWCYRCIEPLAPAGLARHRSGDLLNRVVADVDALDNLYVRVLAPTVIAGGSSVAVAVLVGIFTLPGALWVVTALIAAGVGVPAWAGWHGFSSGRRISTETAVLRRRIVDGVHGMSELLVYDGYPHYAGECMNAHDRLVGEQQRMHHIAGAAAGLVILISGLAVAGVFFSAAPLVTAGAMGGEMLALVILAALAAFEPILPLYTAFQYLGQTHEAARRLS
jgi:ATP-binding cassette subfamily C protein CydC